MCTPMRLLRKITYGEFSELIQEKKVHIIYAKADVAIETQGVMVILSYGR